MADKWIQIAMALSTGAILVTLTRLGEALKQLRTRIDILERPAPDQSALAHDPVRPRRMLGALMEEKRSPFAELARWPGGRAAMAAGGLALVATVLALFSNNGRATTETKEQITAVAAKLDSVTAVVGRLRDSVVTLAVADENMVAAKPTKAAPPPVKAAVKAAPKVKLAPAPDLSGASAFAPPKIDSIK